MFLPQLILPVFRHLFHQISLRLLRRPFVFPLRHIFKKRALMEALLTARVDPGLSTTSLPIKTQKLPNAASKAQLTGFRRTNCYWCTRTFTTRWSPCGQGQMSLGGYNSASALYCCINGRPARSPSSGSTFPRWLFPAPLIFALFPCWFFLCTVWPGGKQSSFPCWCLDLFFIGRGSKINNFNLPKLWSII